MHKRSANGSIHGSRHGSANGSIHGSMHGSIHGSMHGLSNGSGNGSIPGIMTHHSGSITDDTSLHITPMIQPLSQTDSILNTKVMSGIKDN